MKATNKIKRVRGYALFMMFLGLIIMYLGVFFYTNPTIFMVFLLIGLIPVLISGAIYFWIGLVSTRALVVQCPNCDKHTRFLGSVDYCMFCNEPLTIEKDLEGLEFSRDYNVKHRRKKKIEEVQRESQSTEEDK